MPPFLEKPALKILHVVEQYEPSVGGMQEVVKQLSERLVKLGHEVTVATQCHSGRARDCQINGVRILGFDIGGNAVRGYTGGDFADYQNFLLRSSFDIVTCFAAQQWATDLMLPLLQRLHGKKIFVPTGFSCLNDLRYTGYFKRLAVQMRDFDAHVFLSNNYRDINFAREHRVEHLYVIPNGAGADEFDPVAEIDIRKELQIPEDDFLVLHVGTHTGHKGHYEAFDIFNAARIRNATLLIVGNEVENGCQVGCARRQWLSRYLPFVRGSGGGKQLVRSFIFGLLTLSGIFSYGKNKKTIVRSLSREQTVGAYKAADLFLFPSHIECSPIVLFECMAAKLPFLTTDVGNAREIIEWSNGGVILPTKPCHDYFVAELRQSARILEKVVRDEALRKKMAEAGYKSWKLRFSWEKIATEYENLYAGLLAGSE